MLPERRLVRDGGALVGTILSSWSAPGWPDQETAQIYQTAMRIPPVAHTSLEYQRWFVRSTFRPDGLRYARQMRSPVAAPVLHLHGALDPCILPQTARGAGRYVEGPYRWKVIEGPATTRTRSGPSSSIPSSSAGWPTPNRTVDGRRAGRAASRRAADRAGPGSQRPGAQRAAARRARPAASPVRARPPGRAAHPR